MVQVRTQNETIDFILSGLGYSQDQQTLLQDATRTAALEPYTLMAKVAASQKWVPFTDETATDGSAIPQGIYIGPSITAAELVAGDVLDRAILVGGNVAVDEEQLVIENSKTLDTVLGATIEQRTVRDELARRGIFVGETIAISEQQS